MNNNSLLHKTFSGPIFENKLFALEKYFLTSNVYAKYYIKVIDVTEISKKNKIKLFTLENTFNQFNVSFRRRTKWWEKTKQNFKKLNRTLKVGSSLGLKFFKFKNEYNDLWSFKSLLPTFKTRTKRGTAIMFKFFKSLNLKSKKSYSLFFIRAIKGGFHTYSHGAKFFFPRSQLKYALNNAFFKRAKKVDANKDLQLILKLMRKKKKCLFVPPVKISYRMTQVSVWKNQRLKINFRSARKKRTKNFIKFRLVTVFKDTRKPVSNLIKKTF